MKGTWFVLSTIVLITPPWAYPNVTVTSPMKVQSCGTVLDADLRPIAGASVSLAEETGRGISVQSDANGSFSVPLSGKKLHLSVKIAGFQDLHALITEVSLTGTACRHPMLVIMEVGGETDSYVTAKKSDLPRKKKD